VSSFNDSRLPQRSFLMICRGIRKVPALRPCSFVRRVACLSVSALCKETVRGHIEPDDVGVVDRVEHDRVERV
jgi:hypothetical protein